MKPRIVCATALLVLGPAAPAFAQGAAAAPPDPSECVRDGKCSCSAPGPGCSCTVAVTPPDLLVSLAEPPLAGYKDGLLYLRDPRDILRLYPHGQLDLDAHGFFGAGVSAVPASLAGVSLAPSFFVRHARFDLAGEFTKRIAFDGGIELVANPAIDGSRANGQSTQVALADAWAELSEGRGLGVWLGVFQGPFSLENRTAATQLPMLERNLAVRGFAATGGGKALGAAIVGSTQHQVLHWELGAFGAETTAPTDFEQYFDAMGRFVYTPWGDEAVHPLHNAEIGLSARGGWRTPRDTTGDAAAITTGQGFALWRPTYTDATGRLVHIIPDAQQWGAGAELRIPYRGFVLQGEAFWLYKGMREAYDGFQATSTERTGSLSGVGWYGELSWWPFQTFHLIGDNPQPRTAPQADHLEVAPTPPLPERNGVEIGVLAAGINATYDGASRSGTESASGATSVELYQFSLAVSYWQSSHLRVSLEGNAYYAPTTASPPATVLPGNLGPTPIDANASLMGELGGRVSVMF